MSMLTPPEMGGPYRIKGNKYPRMRRNRRRRKVLALIGAVLAVSLVGWGTLQLVDVFTGDDDRSPVAGARKQAACRADAKPGDEITRPAKLPEPGGITVNVLNATTRTGLAQKTADQLEKRGFKIGKVDNATKEYDKKVDGPGVLLGPPTSERTSLRVLGTQLAEAETATDDRKGTAVDLIIGNAFKTLTPEQEATAALKALSRPTPSPSPSC